MGLQPLEIFLPYSAGIDFRRQNLTSTDVRFGRLKSIPALEELRIFWYLPGIDYLVSRAQIQIGKSCPAMYRARSSLQLLLVEDEVLSALFNVVSYSSIVVDDELNHNDSLLICSIQMSPFTEGAIFLIQ